MSLVPLGRLNGMDYEVANSLIKFSPNSFFRANKNINKYLVNLLLREMDISSNDCVINYFCGFGNLSIPIVKQAKKILGIEYNFEMLENIRKNPTLYSCDNLFFVEIYYAILIQVLIFQIWVTIKNHA